MVKLIEIDECIECPYVYYEERVPKCNRKGKRVITEMFPRWCPLPNAEQSTRLWEIVEEMKKMSLEIAQKDDLILMSGEVMRTIRDLEQIAAKLERED